MMACIVRALSDGDLVQASQIRLEALRDHPSVFLSKYENEVKRGPDEWRSVLFGEDRCFFGLMDNGVIVGLIGIITWKDDPSGEYPGAVVAHYIKPDYRGRGLSVPMYQACIHWALGHRAWKRVIVTHRAGNEGSRKAILAAGFQFTHNEPMIWPDGNEDNECIYAINLEEMRQKQ
ncbi:MAG: GNAT family N-acetyltransferase [Alphaproteobacteria bacterium]|nr:GNAT family N-acetyltransferase [Alphaproteobacteria bacterium]MBV8549484.1 GNAT family N-acetyltransferase [Alphaproteobacteria bacterium]